MKTIKVSDGLVINADSEEWRLVTDRTDGLTLFQAGNGLDFWSYRPEFARMRGLPAAGELPVDVIEDVVVGWSQSDATWHLGVVFGAELAAERGGRWCQLARWTDAAAVSRSDVEDAGRLLATVLGKRLRVVGPQTEPVVKPVTLDKDIPSDNIPVSATSVTTSDAAAPPVPPSPIVLPLTLADWRLRQIDIGFQWERVGVWSWRTMWNVIGRLLLAVIFIGVSLLTLQSPYAPVQPAFLPYVGLVLGSGLIIAALVYVIQQMRTEAVVIDVEERQVRRHLDLTSDVVASYEFDDIAAVVATQISQGGRQRGENGAPDTMTHEGWLHFLLTAPQAALGRARDFKPEDAYFTIGYVSATEGEVTEAHFDGARKGREPRLLTRYEATTDVLRAAIVLAEAIGVDAYIDQR